MGTHLTNGKVAWEIPERIAQQYLYRAYLDWAGWTAINIGAGDKDWHPDAEHALLRRVERM